MTFLGNGLSQQIFAPLTLIVFLPLSEAMTPETIYLMLCNIGGYSISLNSILNESSAFLKLHSHNLYLQIVLFVSSFTLPVVSVFLPIIYCLQFQGKD